jgi:Na+-transporting NADH:ubiquinone oxidoreductase subunit NqrC
MKNLILPLLLISIIQCGTTKVVLTPADREQAHIALENLISTQATIIQLQAKLPDLQKNYSDALEILKKKCNSDVQPDNNGYLQCVDKVKK